MRNVNGHFVALQAHRGVSTDAPENTFAAFEAAVKQGYDIIELDPKFTLDNQCVILHDKNLKRTGRTPDGKAYEEAPLIKEITLEEAQRHEYGSWFAPQFKGEKMPLMEDVLRFAKEHSMPLKIDNVIQSFTEEQTEILFSLVEKTGTQHLAGFTSTKVEYLKKAAERFPTSAIHYDGPVDQETLNAVCAVLHDNPLYVWLRYPNNLSTWCKTPPICDETVAMVREKGAKIGLWILEDEADMIDACERFKPDVIETTGSLKPDQE